jgi:proteic killer suppression protein
VKGMIVSFGSKDTEKIWEGIRVKKLPIEVQTLGRRKLRMVNNSVDVNDLRIPPSNRLEKLSGNLKGFYSIRINKQWRIIFMWHNGNASEVSIKDYH